MRRSLSILLLAVLVCASGCKKFRSRRAPKDRDVMLEQQLNDAVGMEQSDESKKSSVTDEDLEELNLTTDEGAKLLSPTKDALVKDIVLEDEESASDAMWSDPYAEDAQYGFKAVYFDFNQHAIADEQEPALDHNVQVIKDILRKNKNAKIAIEISCEGHTCVLGSDEYNMTLSEKRARAVRDYFVKHGIAKKQLSVVGRGRTMLSVQPDEQGDARKLKKQQEPNRRVQLHVIKNGK